MDEHLMERIIRLERENRRLRRVGLAALLVVGGVFLLGQAAPKKIPEVLEARSFQVVHTDGKVVAALGTRPHGTPSLTLWDRDGKLRANLLVGPDGAPGLRLWDKDQKVRAALVTTPDGTPSLEVRDKDEKRGVKLGTTIDGAAFLSVGRPKFKVSIDGIGLYVVRDGKEEISLTAFPRMFGPAEAFLNFRDTDGKTRARLGLLDHVLPTLEFFDKEGKKVWRAQ